MVNIILISHGAFCEGLLASLQMIAGGDYGVRAVPLIPGESPEAYREKLETVMREADDGSGSGTIVLSDIAGGTPFQSAAYLSKDFKLGLVSGMNMPCLLYTSSVTQSSQSASISLRLIQKNSVFIRHF